MNKKFTKLLSVFVIAGAIGTGTALGLAGCGHKHTAADKWESNESQHWHECTANDGAKLDEGAHVDADNNGKCDVCDYQMSTPAAEYTVTFNANGHGTAPAAATTVNGKVTKPADLSDSDFDFGGWFTDAACTTEFDFNTALTANTTLYAKWTEKAVDLTPVNGVVSISSVKQFLAFRQVVEIPADVTEYQLTADIDLAGVTLEAPKVVLTEGKTFNGAGFTIKNASYTEAAAKTGILCASINGGSVTDVKFLGCAVSSANESPAIVAGLVNGASSLTKIEFNSCSVATTSNYGGLLFARNDVANAVITIEEITAKNGCTTQCAQYGGLLMGDMVATTKVAFKNLDVAGEFKGSSGNGSFIAGRTRGGEVSVENAVISAEMPVANSIGIFSGNGALAKLTIRNVLILKANDPKLYQANKAPVEKIVDGLYAVSGVTVDEASATAGENTVEFLSTTLGFDFAKVWKTEGENNAKYRLKAASTNVKSADATISEVKVNANNAKTRFKKGEEFTAAGLNVMGVYSDDVQLVLKADEGYEVDASAFNKDAAGEYTITVKSVEDATKTATYKVTVAEETGFEIIDNHMDHVYLVGDSLDTANLVVKSIWSDGIKEKLAASEYTITASSYDMTTAGAYEVSITHGTYEAKKIKISVLNSIPQPVDGKVYVNVDATATQNGALVNGVETFTSVKDAINFYETIGYDKEVVKVINVGEGTYTDKITTDLDNLVLVGKGTDKSILTYSAVESTVDPVSGSQYGLKCATLQVNGEGFRAYNIAIRNDFDYKNDNKKEASPQGLALTINGDQAVLQNVYLYGNQDTLYLKSGRTYIKDSQIDGNIDFIFGEAKGLAFFDNCTIKAINKSNGQEKNNGYVTAMKATEADKPDYGYIFSNCTFTDDGTLLEGSMSLGRPWGAKATVAYIGCSFTKAYSKLGYTADDKTKSRWFSMSGNSPVNADFCEYGSTGEGAVTEAVDGGKVLTAEQAANYTKANIFAATNGKCTWSAAWDCDAAVTALATLVGGPVAATEIYVSATSIEVEEGKESALYIGTAPWNANDKSVTVTVADETVATWSNGTLKGIKAGTTTITVEKTGMTSKTVNVTVKAPAGNVETKTYTYSYAAIQPATIASNGKTALTAADFTGVNAFLGFVDGAAITHRSDGGKNFIEIKNDSLTVTFAGTGTLKISFASTGDSNKSRFGLKSSSGYVAGTTTATAVTDAEAGSYEVTGTTATEIVYTITEAGTYTLSSPSSVTTRGCRLLAVEMVDNVPASAPTTTTYTYSYAAIQPATIASNGKTALTAADFTGVNAFLGFVNGAAITHRSDGGKNFIEIKNDSLTVTFAGTGTLKISFASTGDSNKSRFGLKSSSGYVAGTTTATAVTDAEAGSYEVTGTTATEIVYTITAPGTYTLSSPSSVTTRGCRLLAVEMVDNT